MDIYEALKRDHDKVKSLLVKLTASSQAPSSVRKEVLRALRDEVIPHSRAEEAVFYNHLRSIDESKKSVEHSFREHLKAETLLRTLQGMEAMNMEWKKTAKKLRETLEHHIEQEEDRVFPVARQVISEHEAELMCTAFERIKPEVRAGSFGRNTLDLIANMLPDKLASPLRSFTIHP